MIPNNIIYSFNTIKEENIIDHLDRSEFVIENINIKTYVSKIYEFADLFEAWHNGKLVGLCACYINDTKNKIAYITHISICPNYRNMRIGECLIKMVEDRGIEKNFDQIQLEVKKNNFIALYFYKKMGFFQINENSINYLMKKNIK